MKNGACTVFENRKVPKQTLRPAFCDANTPSDSPRAKEITENYMCVSAIIVCFIQCPTALHCALVIDIFAIDERLCAGSH